MDATLNALRTDAGLGANLTDRVTALAAAKLRLFKSTLVPTPTTPRSDFNANVADFTGYADVTLTYSAVLNDADGGKVALTNRALFSQTADTVTNTIGGMWIDTAGTEVEDYWEFDPPIGMNAAGSFIAAVIGLREPRPDTATVET